MQTCCSQVFTWYR